MTALDEAIREAEECLRRRERIVPPTMDSREADALRNLLAAAKAPAPALPGVVQPDVVRAAAIVSERLRVYGDTSAYLYDCPGLVAEVTDLLDAIDSSPVACNAILADEYAFLRELLVAVIKTGTKDQLLDARIAEELRSSVPAPANAATEAVRHAIATLRGGASHLLAMSTGAHHCPGCGLLYAEWVAATVKLEAALAARRGDV